MTDIQFDIEIPYTTHPRMRKNTGPIYNRFPNTFYTDEKNKQLNLFAEELYAETQESKINQLVQKSCRHLGFPEKSNIKEFALLFEEDVAIIHKGILSAICFCFPSSWIPADKIGLTLSEIHQPVADNSKLILASDKLTKTMSDPVLGSFRRQVWTITTNPGLSNHPKLKTDFVPKTIEDLYFRIETQTTEPLNDSLTSLFFVKVDVLPLQKIWSVYGDKIISSINSMSDAIIKYKNLENIKSVLNKIE